MSKIKSQGVDSARSWLVAAAAFVIQLISVGSNRANGLLFVAFVEYNQCSREEASWPFTMPGAGVILCAPLTGYLATKVPARTVTILGILLMALGSAVCFASTNVYYVSTFFGLVRGAGYGMCLNTVPGIISSSFERHRGTAMGIAMAGDSVGSFVFPLLIQAFLEIYLLKGTFLLLGAMTLHGALGAMYLVAPSEKEKARKLSIYTEYGGVTTLVDDDDSTPPPEEKPEIDEEKPLEKESKMNIQSHLQSESELNNSDIEEDIHEFPDSNTHVSLINGSSEINTKPILLLINNDPPSFSENGNKKKNDDHNDSFDDAIEESQNDTLLEKPLEDARIAIRGDELHSIQDPVGHVTYSPKKKNKKKGDLVTIDKKTLINIFTSRGFYLNIIVQALDMYYISNFNLVIVDYLADKGTSYNQGLFMLTVFAVGQLVGRLGLGWITDKGYMTRAMFLFWTMNLNAGLTVLLTYLDDFVALMFCGALLGMVGGTLLPTSNVIFSDYLKKENINLAVAFTIFFKGLVSMTRIPLIGFCRDQLGSYDYMFHFMAGMLTLSAFTWLFESIYLKRQRVNATATTS